MNGRWRTLLTAIALPLLFLPLRAAEAPAPPPSAEQPAPPATPPASPGEAPPATDPAAAPADDSANERVSVDNNLTFPVDI